MRVAVMASGRGSNFQAIIDSADRGEIPHVAIEHLIVNNNKAYAIDIAKKHNINYTIIESKGKNRKDFDDEALKLLKAQKIEIIVLAGFMRILTPVFINTYKNKIINIHPSLLPSFPGAHAQRDAILHGAKISGCTAHLVDEGIDSGPIIMQDCVNINETDTEKSLARKILTLEHELFPKAIELLCSNKIELNGRNIIIKPD